MTKRNTFLPLLLCALLLLALLTACGDGQSPGGDAAPGIITVANSPDGIAQNENRTPLDQAAGFTFDFESLEYSFTGAANAEFYYIRVFPVVNGAEGNSASFQSEKIDANSSNTYSGVIQDQALLAGDYIAHVVASAAGYSSSDVSVSGSSKMQGSPAVSATWNTGAAMFPGMPAPEPAGDEPVPVTADITITAAAEAVTQSYTLVITDASGAEVYRDNAAQAGSLNLTAQDLGAAELSTEDVYSVTVTVNQVSGYKVPAEGVTVQIAERRFGGPPM